MDRIDYQELYRLQDKVLQVVFKAEREFYLTGGTCLSRFYFEKRYSDDLIIRLKTFPRSLLKHIKLIDSSFLHDFDETYTKIIDEIVRNV